MVDWAVEVERSPLPASKTCTYQQGYIGVPSGEYTLDPVSCDELDSCLKPPLDDWTHGRYSTNVVFPPPYGGQCH